MDNKRSWVALSKRPGGVRSPWVDVPDAAYQRLAAERWLTADDAELLRTDPLTFA